MGTVTLPEVVESILDGDLDGEEQTIYDAIRQRRTIRNAVVAAGLRRNDHVQISEEIRGRSAGYTGVVTEPATGRRKRPVVRVDDTPETRIYGVANRLFTYPASCLTKIDCPGDCDLPGPGHTPPKKQRSRK